jgi:sugar lactone lactonase YvrE
MPLHRRSLGLIAAGLALPRTLRAQAAPETLARFPNGTFLENLVVEPGGRVLFTNYFARRIEQWSRGAGGALFTEVPDHPVSLTALGDGGYALAVHGASFMDGPAAMRGRAALLLLGADGSVTRRIALPEAIFPNGGLLIAPGVLLLADSALGRVWQVELATGAASIWLEHPLLAPVVGQPYPGVNGIKRAGDAVLLSNSAQRSLLRVRLGGTTAQGAPELMARMTGGVDDFAVARDGTIYAATHAEGLARLAPGATTPGLIAAPGVEGSTAVALTPDGRGLYALGTGGLSSGGRGEAVLALVVLPPA